MKQFEAHHVTVGGNQFHIFPFSAFRAANIYAELTSVLSPVIPALATIMKSNGDFLDMDIEKMTSSLSSLDGDKVESILKRLLLKENNVSVEMNGNAEPLTEGIINELFCGSFENLILLAFEVAKVNYGSFFRSIGLQFGSAGDQQEKTRT